MKKSDIYICGFMYLFSFFFLYLTLDFPEPARHYPYFVIGLLLLLTTVRMSHLFRDYRREHKIISDSSQVFDGFLPKQFWVMFAAFLLFFSPDVPLRLLHRLHRIHLHLPPLLQDQNEIHFSRPDLHGRPHLRYIRCISQCTPA